MPPAWLPEASARAATRITMKVSFGQCSDKGRKESNQDFHGVCVPDEPQLSAKGIAAALADGVSSSEVSQVASQAAVDALLTDYYATSDAWSVRKSVERILSATNSWLHAQTRRSAYRYDRDRGYVCTLSALVLKGATAHVFHVGDARIHRLRGGALEQLTTDHRVWITREQSHLARALGVDERLEIDYLRLPLEEGDVFLLTTDGIHEFLSARVMAEAIASGIEDLDRVARELVAAALAEGSDDNLTAQILRVDAVPAREAAELSARLEALPLPPVLAPRMEFDGYRVIRELRGSYRSHIYLASDLETGAAVVLKLPSIDQRGDPAYLERFATEEWVARRIDSPHVLKPGPVTRRRNYLYFATEYLEGQTLAQWMIDHPRPAVEAVRRIVEQVARGLQAFHRLEMLHQDLRPENIMIDASGTARIIDFGSTRVAGIEEAGSGADPAAILGTAQYTAPEYFLGEGGTNRSDIYSLGVIAYQMLTGRLPYGAAVARARTRAAQGRLRYASALAVDSEIPAWLDGALARAVHPDPARRYEELSEFIHDLRHPNPAFTRKAGTPLIERNPVLFWKATTLLFAALAAAVLLGR